MRETKFRQPIWMDGKFAYWHYWGFVKRGEFTGPGYHAEKALEESQQFTGRRDSKRTEEFPKGQEIYAGDKVVLKNNWMQIQKMELIGEVIYGCAAYGIKVEQVCIWDKYNVPSPEMNDIYWFLNIVDKDIEVIGTMHDKEVSNEKN